MGRGRSLALSLLAAVGAVSCPMGHGGPTGAAASAGAFPRDSDLFDEAGPELEAGADDGGVDTGEEGLLDETRSGRLVALDPGPLAPFFDALADLEEEDDGIVRALHWGDSHTAADFLTTAVRRALQERFGDGGRGFVLLGKPWRSYRPIDVSTRASGQWRTERILVAADPATQDGLYGLGGVAVESDQPGASAAVGTTRATGFCREVSTVELFYMERPGGGSFRVFVDGRRADTVRTDSDRIGTGVLSIDLDPGEHEVEVRLRGDGVVRLYGAVLEGDGPGLVYDTLGVNGGFFHTPLKWDPDQLAEQVARRDPDLIVTMYGTNEADSRSLTPEAYERQVTRTIGRLRAGAPDAACLVIGPPDRRPRYGSEEDRSRLDWIVETQREVADEIGCAFMDSRELMGGEGSHERWAASSPALAQPDGVHLTVRGYRELGEQIAEVLLDSYDSYLEEVSDPTPLEGDAP